MSHNNECKLKDIKKIESDINISNSYRNYSNFPNILKIILG